jgi:environmental stress-induced protein Ves
MTRVWRCLLAWSVLVCSLGLAACSNGRGSLEDPDGGGQQQEPGKVTIGGTIAGLSGTGLVLQNNGGDDLAVSANGSFTFATAVDAGSLYDVTILTQPDSPAQLCSVANASGTAPATNVTSVSVTCSAGSFTVGGSVSGLEGSGLVLQNNGADDLEIASNGSFTFATEIASGGAFEVTVLTQPGNPSQTCTVADGSGTVSSGDVRTVKVSCATNTFTIGGTVSGLAGSGLVLQNNGGDDVGVQSDGSFTFPTRIPSGSQFSVTVKTQPESPPQACSVQNGSGTVGAADVTNVTITCVLREFTIGGTLSGLTGSGMVLANNGGDFFTPTANGSFTFPTAVVTGRPYNVTVQTPPLHPLQLCRVTNGSGVVADSNITNIAIDCVTIGIGVGGSVSGLQSKGLELQSNGEKLQIAANGKFLIPASLPDGTPYDLTVSRQPDNQVCTVGNGRGVLNGTDAVDITVTCK